MSILSDVKICTCTIVVVPLPVGCDVYCSEMFYGDKWATFDQKKSGEWVRERDRFEVTEKKGDQLFECIESECQGVFLVFRKWSSWDLIIAN